MEAQPKSFRPCSQSEYSRRGSIANYGNGVWVTIDGAVLCVTFAFSDQLESTKRYFKAFSEKGSEILRFEVPE